VFPLDRLPTGHVNRKKRMLATTLSAITSTQDNATPQPARPPQTSADGEHVDYGGPRPDDENRAKICCGSCALGLTAGLA
jgi:hypothetical protein